MSSTISSCGFLIHLYKKKRTKQESFRLDHQDGRNETALVAINYLNGVEYAQACSLNELFLNNAIVANTDHNKYGSVYLVLLPNQKSTEVFTDEWLKPRSAIVITALNVKDPEGKPLNPEVFEKEVAHVLGKSNLSCDVFQTTGLSDFILVTAGNDFAQIITFLEEFEKQSTVNKKWKFVFSYSLPMYSDLSRVENLEDMEICLSISSTDLPLLNEFQLNSLTRSSIFGQFDYCFRGNASEEILKAVNDLADDSRVHEFSVVLAKKDGAHV